LQHYVDHANLKSLYRYDTSVGSYRIDEAPAGQLDPWASYPSNPNGVRLSGFRCRCPSRVSQSHWLLHYSHTFDFYQYLGQDQVGDEGRAGGWVFGEKGMIDLVHLEKVLRISQEHGHLNHPV
jgi:hypothetical protein